MVLQKRSKTKNHRRDSMNTQPNLIISTKNLLPTIFFSHRCCTLLCCAISLLFFRFHWQLSCFFIKKKTTNFNYHSWYVISFKVVPLDFRKIKRRIFSIVHLLNCYLVKCSVKISWSVFRNAHIVERYSSFTIFSAFVPKMISTLFKETQQPQFSATPTFSTQTRIRSVRKTNSRRKLTGADETQVFLRKQTRKTHADETSPAFQYHFVALASTRACVWFMRLYTVHANPGECTHEVIGRAVAVNCEWTYVDRSLIPSFVF